MAVSAVSRTSSHCPSAASCLSFCRTSVGGRFQHALVEARAVGSQFTPAQPSQQQVGDRAVRRLLAQDTAPRPPRAGRHRPDRRARPSWISRQARPARARRLAAAPARLLHRLGRLCRRRRRPALGEQDADELLNLLDRRPQRAEARSHVAELLVADLTESFQRLQRPAQLGLETGVELRGSRARRPRRTPPASASPRRWPSRARWL